MKRRRTIEETAHRQWRKLENAVIGLTAEELFKFAFRRAWRLARARRANGK